MEIILDNKKKISMILQLVLIYAWLTVLSVLSVTDTYYSVYIFCGALGFLCVYANYKNVGTMDYQSSWARWSLSVVFSLSVVMANYQLFEPLTVLENIFNVCCCFAGGLSIGNAILLYLQVRLPLDRKKNPEKGAGLVFFAVFSLICLIDLLYLFFSCYPGILTRDSISTISQIVGDSGYNNTMPFWHTVTVKPFIKLGLRLFGNMNAAVGCFHVAQVLYMAACMAFVVMTLYQSGVPGYFLVMVAIIYAFQPHNIVYSITLWKDVPFAGATSVIIVSLYRILRGIGKRKILNYFLFILGALGFSLWRTNGWYAFLATFFVMIFLLRHKNKYLLILMATMLIVCWILINPLLDVLGVSSTNLVEAFAVPMQQVARVIAQGRALTEEETQLLGEIFLLEKIPGLYDPITVDPIKFETFRYDQVDYIVNNALKYVHLYLSLAVKYPGDYLKAWIDETKGYWNAGYFYWIYTLKNASNPYGIETVVRENLIAKMFAALFRFLEKPAILQPLTSIGLHVWALVSCTFINIAKKKTELLLSIPLLVLIVGLWIGTPVFAEFRYAYPIVLCMPFILGVTIFTPDPK